MKFPTLETMVEYGIYTVKDLILFSQDRLVPRNTKVYYDCPECHLVSVDVICPRSHKKI
jgi:hypothetical protein